jgi:hypothetical protein
VFQEAARWSCHACGACCHGLVVEISREEESRIDAKLYPDLLGAEHFAERPQGTGGIGVAILMPIDLWNQAPEGFGVMAGEIIKSRASHQITCPWVRKSK